MNRKKNFVIYDSGDSVSLIKSIIKSRNMNDIVEHKDAKRTISERKNKGYIPDQAGLHCDSQSEERILEIYQEYRKQCQDSNALDFDDLLLLPKLLFERSNETLNKWQSQFHHILVDEAQDTNEIQFQLMKSLSEASSVKQSKSLPDKGGVDEGGGGFDKTITFIGDDYQSIYRRRGAVMSNFLNLEKRRPGISTFKLEINYRSLPHIVEAGNAIIKQNKVQYDKDVKAHREGDKHIRVFEFADEKDEAIQLIDMITKLKEEGNKKRDDFTILYRTNAQSAPFEQVCITDAIPYKIIGGQRFFERKEVKDVLSYIKFLLNPSDSLTLKRIINTPARQIGKTTIDQLQEIATNGDTTFAFVVLHIDQYSGQIKPAAITKIKKFVNMINAMLQSVAMMTPAQLLDQIVKGTKYADRVEKQDGKDKADERMGNVGQLINMAMKFTDVGIDSTTVFLEEVSLMTSIEEESPEDADAIKMMTVHGSKGLEFPSVFLVGLEENIFPLPKAKFDDAELEEERRGMYVAITRAQDHLFVSYANSRRQRGQIKYNPVSRFINELPPHLVKTYNLAGAATMQSGFDKTRDEAERVTHKLFGPGVILEVWDQLCIVRFDNPKFNVRKIEGRWLKAE